MGADGHFSIYFCGNVYLRTLKPPSVAMEDVNLLLSTSICFPGGVYQLDVGGRC